ncbi:MAG: cation:proton antiporter [Betaproteobacteria bacterium]|nr:cation:proton antiporter [Betaproteobacteria bacterium]
MMSFEFLPQFPLPANPLALFGVLLLAGALGGELTRRVLNLPRITGYVLIGLTLGASGLDVLDSRMLGYARIFFDVGLGLVLFELGRRLDFTWLKRDRWLLVMATAESLLSFGCMFGALLWFHIAPLYAAVAAAIGISSSPAIVMLVARELRAEGQVTERALNLVAINSVVAFVLMTMLLSWIHREYHAGWFVMVLHPVYILVGSLFAGFLASVLALGLARWLGKKAELHIALLLAVVLLLVGAAEALKLSVLIALLTFGVLVKNLDDDHVLMPVDIGRLGQMFFIVLFVTTGAMLQITDVVAGGAVAVIYIAARFVGKSIGVLSFAHLSGIRAGIGGLLSIALLPMSGIALAMTHSASSLYPAFGAKLATIVLAAALILELIGPLAVQFALRHAGEAREEA